MREQVVTTRGGRTGAGAKGRGAVAVQRPSARRPRAQGSKDSRQKGFALKAALPYVPSLLKAALAVSLGLLAYLGYRTAVSASFFKVKAVDVAGATRASREEIRAAVTRLSAAGVWQADLDVITKELRELPWVRDAVVTRVLPDGLRVRVTEREPRVISRTLGGRLVWVDDDGVSLGAATPGEQDFFVRGLEEGRGEDALRHNRERVRAALELSRYWAAAGLSRRVSEVNLEDLRDVRVQLAGDDAAVEVRLGREDFAERFRKALGVLDAQRLTQRGPYVTYIDVSQGKRAVVGTGSTAQYQPSAPEEEAAPAESLPPDAPSARGAQDRPASAANATRPASKESKKPAAQKPAKAGEAKKKPERAATAAATRPRRVDGPTPPEE